MNPNLQVFLRALQAPDVSFATLRSVRATTGTDSLPILVRTTRFVEAEITWQDEQWLLSMPLSPAAMLHIERTASVLRRFKTPHLTEYRILSNELLWCDALGNEHQTDLVLQHLPAGKTLEEALLTEDHGGLLNALDALQTGLRELGFTHNNLKPANLRWCSGRFVPLRYHDARISEGDDTAAFDTLRSIIAKAPDSQTLCDTTAAYEPLRTLDGHRWTSHVFEGLICVEDETGYGFVDTDNRPVIPAQFIWAGDFHENRAEVETSSGMGLIDREGRYIIPAEYEIVDYDPAASIVHVRQGGKWALFDYLGRRLTEFGDRTGMPEPCRFEICN